MGLNSMFYGNILKICSCAVALFIICILCFCLFTLFVFLSTLVNIFFIMQNSSLKRKRTQNTVPEQYQIYLEEMESDFIFRSGMIDPTVDKNYIDTKWEHLTRKLNSLGKGPSLSKDIWQKRFKDWKNATRSKYRRIQENRVITGGGPQDNIELTELEERGLEVWGKVTVTGTPLVLKTGGLSLVEMESGKNDTSTCIRKNYSDTPQVTEHMDESEHTEEIIIELSGENDNVTDDIKAPSTSHSLSSPNVTKFSKKTFQKGRKMSLTDAARDLKDSYENNSKILRDITNHIPQFLEVYRESQMNRNNIEQVRLKFEIEKYKYENENFNFDLEF